MSHVARIDDLIISDLDALQAAAAERGLEFCPGQTDFARDSPYESRGGCAHTLKIAGTTPKMGYEGPWEIGLRARPDGTGFQMMYDRFGKAGKQLEEHAGQNLGLLKESYATEVAKRHLYRLGYRVSVVRNAQGQQQVIGVRA